MLVWVALMSRRASVVSSLVLDAVLKPCALYSRYSWLNVEQDKSFIIRFVEGVLFAA
jgi:hypothetical protein